MTRRVAIGAVVVNALLALALVVLSLDPQRERFGRTTGLWHPCYPSRSGGVGYEHWSPLLLVFVGAFVATGVVLAYLVSGRLRVMAMAASSVLLIVGIALVAVPTGSCIA